LLPLPLSSLRSPTCLALRSIPLASSVPSLTPTPDWLMVASQDGHPLSSLVGFTRLSTVRLDVSIGLSCSACSAPRDLRVLRRVRVRCVLRQSEEAPETPLGFSSAWVEKSSGFLRTLRGECGIFRADKAFRARVHPTSRSAAVCILQHSPWCSHTGTRPPLRMRSVASPLPPPRSRPRRGWMVRVSGLEMPCSASSPRRETK